MRKLLLNQDFLGAKLHFYCLHKEFMKVNEDTGEFKLRRRLIFEPGQILTAVPYDPYRDGKMRYGLTEDKLSLLAPDAIQSTLLKAFAYHVIKPCEGAIFRVLGGWVDFLPQTSLVELRKLVKWASLEMENNPSLYFDNTWEIAKETFEED